MQRILEANMFCFPYYFVSGGGRVKNMKDILKEYQEAVIEAQDSAKAEDGAKLRRRKAYYRLLDVKERLRIETQELLNNNLVLD